MIISFAGKNEEIIFFSSSTFFFGTNTEIKITDFQVIIKLISIQRTIFKNLFYIFCS